MEHVIVTPHFLGAICELSDQDGRDVLEALLAFISNPNDVNLCRQALGIQNDGVESIRAGESCRILFSAVPDAKFLFAGPEKALRRFMERIRPDATAFAEAPVAFQLRLDFWQGEPGAVFETPSCGATVDRRDLIGLIEEARPYLPLAHLLLSRGREIGSLLLTFDEIETVLGQALPAQARRDPGWWANDRSQFQSAAWLTIGWNTAQIDLQGQTVTFVRSALP